MHVRDENLERYVLGRLSPSGAARTQSHISKCDVCQIRLKQAVESIGSGKERRREVRNHVDAPASTQALNPSSSDRSDIRILDVSKGGLKMRVPERMEPGTKIQIHLKKTLASGEVRYCRSVGGGFHVGVKFERVSPVKQR